MFGRTTEVDERFAQALAQRGGILARGEPHEARTAVTHRGDQREQRLTSAPDNREIGLHLLARRGLEAHYRLGFGALVWRQEQLALTDAAFVAGLLHLAKKGSDRIPVR